MQMYITPQTGILNLKNNNTTKNFNEPNLGRPLNCK